MYKLLDAGPGAAEQKSGRTTVPYTSHPVWCTPESGRNVLIITFLPEVRECITRHTAYNKHDTGWAKGAPSEDHTSLYPTVLPDR